MTENKPWYASKTMWVNILAGLAMVVQSSTGFIVNPEAQAAVIVIANLILRAVTKGAVTLKG